MKKLVATLLALVMIGTCSVGLASNSNISGFVNNLLDALNDFNIDSQAMQGSIYEPTRGNSGGYHPASEMIGVDSQKIGSLFLQKKGGMYQMRIHSDQMGNDVAALEFNDQLIRAQSEGTTYEIRYQDIQEIIDQLLVLVQKLPAVMGVDIDLDAIADIDFFKRINDTYGGSEIRIISEYAPPRAEPITRRNVLTLRFASLEVILKRRKVIKKFIMKRTST